MACWELGLQLKRDWLPTLEKTDVKLLVVGIGTAESAKTWAEEIGLPPEIVFGDEEADAYKALKLVNSNFDEDGRKRGMRMLTERTTQSIKGRKNGRNVNLFGLIELPFLATNDDLEEAVKIYKPLTPQGDGALDKTLVQGGVLAFEGDIQTFKHRDTSVAVHADPEKVFAAVGA